MENSENLAIFFNILKALLFIAFLIFYVKTASKVVKERKKEFSAWKNNNFTISSDGHLVPKSEDLTCDTTQNHNHDKRLEQDRYVVHDHTELNSNEYIILNGKKVKLKDCKDL